MTSSIVCINPEFTSAVKFLDALSPRVEPWYPHPDRWIFRGQRDATWGLRPSSSRPNFWHPFDRFVDASLTPVGYTNHGRLEQELGAVWRFSRDADRQGLLVPGFDHTWVGDADLETKFKDLGDVFAGREFFPKPEWQPLFGMAQHYGVPTRLLDWSERPLVAAYFAASGAANAPAGAAQHFAVWALDRSWALERCRLKPSADEQIIIVTPPWATNPNLRAQRGLFTLHGVRLPANDQADDIPLEDAIQKLAGDPQATETGHKPRMYKLCLGVEKAPLLMHLLDQEGISAASIYPGYKGVVDAMGERHGVANYRDDPTESFPR